MQSTKSGPLEGYGVRHGCSSGRTSWRRACEPYSRRRARSVGSRRRLGSPSADSLSLESFVGWAVHERVADHPTLSRLRTRLPLKVYEQVFVMRVLNQRGLLQDRLAGVDATYLRAGPHAQEDVKKTTTMMTRAMADLPSRATRSKRWSATKAITKRAPSSVLQTMESVPASQSASRTTAGACVMGDAMLQLPCTRTAPA